MGEADRQRPSLHSLYVHTWYVYTFQLCLKTLSLSLNYCKLLSFNLAFCVTMSTNHVKTVGRAISCRASARIHCSSCFNGFFLFFFFWLYLSRHVYEFSQIANFPFHCAIPVTENPSCSACKRAWPATSTYHSYSFYGNRVTKITSQVSHFSTYLMWLSLYFGAHFGENAVCFFFFVTGCECQWSSV